MVGFLFSAETRRNPYPWYEQMRQASPVFCDPGTGTWMLFDYASVRAVMNDQETFSSRVVPPGGRAPDWLVFNDPPRHSLLRAAVMRAFTPRAIAELEPRIRQISADLLAAASTTGEMDLIADYATPLPTLVIAEMMGIPSVDRERFAMWSQAIVNLSYSMMGGAEAQRTTMEFYAVRPEMHAYVMALVAERRAQPGSDLLSTIIQSNVDGQRLTEDDVFGFFLLLLSAATETTTNLIGNAVVTLLEHPDQLQLLRERRELLPGAIEEIVRFRSPGQVMFRQTTRDVQMHGRVIPANSFVLVMVGSANRDTSHIADAGQFLIARSPNPHIAFGHGIHFCLGAALARLEGRIALTHLLDEFSTIELADETPWEPRQALHVHGPARLPIRLAADRGRRRIQCSVSTNE
jgi:cytochrome P450